MKRFYILLFLLISAPSLSGQIYNVEAMRTSINYDGWYMVPDFNIKLDYSDNFVFILGTKLDMYFRIKDDLILWANYVNFTFANKQQLINNSFSHIRHDHAFSPVFQLESFAEIRQNEVKLIDLRTMLGHGPRLRFFEREGNYMYWAFLYAFEYEKLLPNPSIFKINNFSHRLVTYLSFNFNFWKIKSRKLIGFNVVTYYQPKIFHRVGESRSSVRILDYKAFRILSDITLAFYFHKNFSIKFTGNVYYNHTPPPGVNPISTSLVPKLSANLKFGSRTLKKRKRQFEEAMDEIEDDSRRNGRESSSQEDEPAEKEVEK